MQTKRAPDFFRFLTLRIFEPLTEEKRQLGVIEHSGKTSSHFIGYLSEMDNLPSLRVGAFKRVAAFPNELLEHFEFTFSIPS